VKGLARPGVFLRCLAAVLRDPAPKVNLFTNGAARFRAGPARAWRNAPPRRRKTRAVGRRFSVGRRAWRRVLRVAGWGGGMRHPLRVAFSFRMSRNPSARFFSHTFQDRVNRKRKDQIKKEKFPCIVLKAPRPGHAWRGRVEGRCIFS
jgi:hypothetical protein